MSKFKLAVLISGRGTNLQSLIDASKASDFPAEIILVISNNPEAQGLARATQADISTKVINHKEFANRLAFDEALDEAIAETGADLICLAGFMRLLTPEFTKKWEDKIINIHPSLLPDFKGANPHRDVIASGADTSGCTVHYVTAEMDSGPIILQKEVPVLPNDTEESLAARILEQEHVIYPQAIRKIAEKL